MPSQRSPAFANRGRLLFRRVAGFDSAVDTVPMIGGMISSTLLTLIVIPAIFVLVNGFG